MSYTPPPLTSAQVGALMAALPIPSVGWAIYASVQMTSAQQFFASGSTYAGSLLTGRLTGALGLTGTWILAQKIGNDSYPSAGYGSGIFMRIA